MCMCMATFDIAGHLGKGMGMGMEDRPESKESVTTDGLGSIIGTSRTDQCPPSLTVYGDSASVSGDDEQRFNEILNMQPQEQVQGCDPAADDPYRVVVSFLRHSTNESHKDSDVEVKLQIAGMQLSRDSLVRDLDLPEEEEEEEEKEGQVAPGIREECHSIQAESIPITRMPPPDYQYAVPPPYRGGYYDKRTGKKFLHASQQTYEIVKEAKKRPEMFTKETQIYLVRNECTVTKREASVQMDRPGILLDNSRDYILIPGPYADSEEWKKLHEAASTTIQRYARGWIARRKANRLRTYLEDSQELHSALGKSVSSRDERMCVLGYVKWTVQEFECPLTREILQLIEREADLMYRNRPSKSLSRLRQRILSLFLEFVETPELNQHTKLCLPTSIFFLAKHSQDVMAPFPQFSLFPTNIDGESMPKFDFIKIV